MTTGEPHSEALKTGDGASADPTVLQLEKRYLELVERKEHVSRQLVQFVQVNELERRRIAAEIHDTTVQKIAAALLLMDLGGEENLDQVRAYLEEAVRSARGLMGSIHPPLLEEAGVAAAVRETLEQLKSRPGRNLDVTFEAQMGDIPLDAITELIVWRSVSDAIRSSWRDVTTTALSVMITFDGEIVECVVTDDGTSERDGEHPTGAPTSLGTARGTARAAGGDLAVRQDGGGTTVEMQIPKLSLAG